MSLAAGIDPTKTVMFEDSVKNLVTAKVGSG
jgi:hypothetical protein